MSDYPEQLFGREEIESAFVELGRRASKAGCLIDISVYGGSAMVLTFDAASVTSDVDAIFHGDDSWVRKTATEIGLERGWGENWLRDGLKHFLSPKDGDEKSKDFFKLFSDNEEGGVRVYKASSPYLFAMKCMAMRTGPDKKNRDVDDIRMLAKSIGIEDADDALDIVRGFYPDQRMTTRAYKGVVEIFGEPARQENKRQRRRLNHDQDQA